MSDDLRALVAAAEEYLAAEKIIDDPDVPLVNNAPVWERYDRARQRFNRELGYDEPDVGDVAGTVMRFAGAVVAHEHLLEDNAKMRRENAQLRSELARLTVGQVEASR